MLGASHQIKKIKTMLLALSLLLVLVQTSHAQEANEHIHIAKAVMNQTLVKEIESDSASYVIETLDTTLEFSLEINSRLLGNSAFISNNIAVYKGQILGAENSWARFTSVGNQIDGAFFDGTDLFIVKSYKELSSLLDSNALVHRENMQVQDNQNTNLIINVKDIESSGTCALHNDQTNSSQFAIENSHAQFDYELYVDELGEMFNGQAEKEIQISLFADVQFVTSSSDATAEMLTLLNVADGIYSEQIGVQFVLTEATELSDNGTLTSTNATNLIIAFRNTGFNNPGVSHLFTNKNLDGTTVGIAYVGSLCRNSSVGVTQKFGSKTAIIFAHELGHNFGSPHDNESGSACSSTPSGFIMNPNVNSGGNVFSSCSVERMQPTIANASCIADVTPEPVQIEIISVPNENAELGMLYSYDDDNTVEVSGQGPFSFNLDIAPTGMTISDEGVINWLPEASDVGSNFVQLTVQNSDTQATQTFDVEVASEFLNIQEGLQSFNANGQDSNGTATFDNNPLVVELEGNTWKQLLGSYTITQNTVLEFEFSSQIEGEIHGIGFGNNDDAPSDETYFNLHGKQVCCLQDVKYTQNGSIQLFSIPVGNFYTGTFDRIVFINDNDKNLPGVNSTFGYIRLYESTTDVSPPQPYLDFNTLVLEPHLPSEQDVDGTVIVIDEGAGIELTGNKWQRIEIEDVSIKANSMLEFEFKSTTLGEIHGIGFLNKGEVDSSRTFNLYGSQTCCISDFIYTNDGEYQKFAIPVGEYLNQTRLSMVFIMDKDKGALDSNSSFKNIRIFETNDEEPPAQFINLETGISPYNVENQDANGTVSFDESSFIATLEGNTWKQILGNYNITENTIVELEFSSGVEGEIHGIGFGNDTQKTTPTTYFKLYGNQSCCIEDLRYIEAGEPQLFTIPVGQFFTGNFDRILLINDNDSNLDGVNSTFGNIRLYEANQDEITNIDLNDLGIVAHLPSVQDTSGTAVIIEDGMGLELTGNKWQRVVINDQAIGANSVIEFEFKSTVMGEIHGIGFLNKGETDSRRTFKLYGSQSCCNSDFTYTEDGEYQKFTIPVGRYLNQTPVSLVFIMDKDNGALNSNSSFRNIKIYDVE